MRLKLVKQTVIKHAVQINLMLKRKLVRQIAKKHVVQKKKSLRKFTDFKIKTIAI